MKDIANNIRHRVALLVRELNRGPITQLTCPVIFKDHAIIRIFWRDEADLFALIERISASIAERVQDDLRQRVHETSTLDVHFLDLMAPQDWCFRCHHDCSMEIVRENPDQAHAVVQIWTYGKTDTKIPAYRITEGLSNDVVRCTGDLNALKMECAFCGLQWSIDLTEKGSIPSRYYRCPAFCDINYNPDAS